MPVVASIPQQISPGQVALKCICRIALPPFLLLYFPMSVDASTSGIWSLLVRRGALSDLAPC